MDEHSSQSRTRQTLSDVLNSLSPKTAAIAGAVAILVLEAIAGFVVMLVLFFGQGASGSKAITNTKSANANTPVTAPAKIEIVPVSKDDHLFGNANAKVTVVEYSDLECPFCKRFHETMKQVVKDYNGQVNWVYRHFPLDSLHSKARNEAKAAECAAALGDNDKFWEYIDLVFAETPANNGLDPAELPNFAERIGLQRADFEACQKKDEFADKITAHVADATKAGGRGTPYSVIIAGDTKIPISGSLPIDQVKAAIDSVLK